MDKFMPRQVAMAIGMKDNNFVRWLIEEDGIDVNAILDTGNSLLMIAAHRSNYTAAEILVRNGAKASYKFNGDVFEVMEHFTAPKQGKMYELCLFALQMEKIIVLLIPSKFPQTNSSLTKFKGLTRDMVGLVRRMFIK